MPALRLLSLSILAACVLASAPARAENTLDEAAKAQLSELSAQREIAIARIMHGSDTDQAIAEFVALLKKRAEILGRTPEALANRKAVDKESLDFQASWRCTLSADPKNPVASDEGRMRADWGKVIRKHALRTVPKNELDDGTPVTLYEIAGQAGPVIVRGEHLGARHRDDFHAEVGDLVLVCEGSRDSDRSLPPPWNQTTVVRSGMAGRIARPPTIVSKARWNPRHITGTRYYWAVHDVKWRYPPGEYVLSYLELHRDLGGGRFEIRTNNDVSFVIEAAPTLPHKELLAAGRSLWLILGSPRFDRGLKTLVLTIEDVEEHYIVEPQK